MNKQRSLSSICAEKVVFAAMVIIMENNSPMYYKKIIDQLSQHCTFSEWENTSVGRLGRPRWQTSLLFFAIHYCMAGFIIKNRGFWEITPSGISAIDKGPDYCFIMAEQAFKQWKRQKYRKHKTAEQK